MAIDVADWLRRLGLERYERSFRDHDVDDGVLAHLTADDLTSLGVTSIGHRRKLLAAIAALEPQPGTTPAAPERAAQARSPDAERRQLTVMFCDIVDSTAIATRLDPEDFGRVLGAFQEACVGAVAGFGGSVAKYM